MADEITKKQKKMDKLKAFKETSREITVKLRKEYDFVVQHDQVDQMNYLEGRLLAIKMLQEPNDKEIDKLRRRIDNEIDEMQALIPLLPSR